MGNYQSDTELDGQMAIQDIFEPPERLFAVSNIFARARKDMTLNEQKTFVYALSEIKFTEEAQGEYVKLDKKKLAKILGITTADADHLSENLFDEIKELPKHSYIQIAARDLGFYSNGFVVTAVTKFRNTVRLRFNGEYLGLFTNLSADYITMWSSDIFQMTSKRSVQFYELLRQMSYPQNLVGENTYSYGWGVKAFKEMFGIPKEGKGSYMRAKGGLNRDAFEKRVLDPLCDDLMKCRMVQLVLDEDGRPYRKVKHGSRVAYYEFHWTLSQHPAVATATEVREIAERVDKNPQVLKVAKDIIDGEKKPRKRKNGFSEFEQHEYDFDELERELLSN